MSTTDVIDDTSHMPADLVPVMEALARVGRDLCRTIKRGPLGGNALGAGVGENLGGDQQKALDVMADEAFADDLKTTSVRYYASEEQDDVVELNPAGKYALAIDPLDGSSNIDVNVSVGTIFSVLRNPPGSGDPTEQSFLQPGNEQVAAGYAIYGPSTQLVLTVGKGVHAFTLDREMGSFIYTHPYMTVPEETNEFAINASNARHWEAPVQRYIAELQEGKSGPRGADFNMRWVASMVADVHRVLTRGGIFMYPMDEKCRAQGGKLRLMYEANPMAMLVEQAGGAASTGRQRILDVQPERLHQRVPVILGSKREVERVASYHGAA